MLKGDLNISPTLKPEADKRIIYLTTTNGNVSDLPSNSEVIK